MKSFLVTITRKGGAVIHAEDKAEAMRIADTLTCDEVCWDDDFYATDAEYMREVKA